MIDRSMIQRLLVQIGIPEATIHDKGMELARAIYAAGMEEEREACAKFVESCDAKTVEFSACPALAAAIRMRSNCNVTGAEPVGGASGGRSC